MLIHIEKHVYTIVMWYFYGNFNDCLWQPSNFQSTSHYISFIYTELHLTIIRSSKIIRCISIFRQNEVFQYRCCHNLKWEITIFSHSQIIFSNCSPAILIIQVSFSYTCMSVKHSNYRHWSILDNDFHTFSYNILFIQEYTAIRQWDNLMKRCHP